MGRVRPTYGPAPATPRAGCGPPHISGGVLPLDELRPGNPYA